MKTFFILFFGLFSFSFCHSQSSLQGTVTDNGTGEPIIFGTVALYQDDILLTGTETDFDGYYSFTEIKPGTYDLVFSYTGFTDQKIAEVIVPENEKINLNVALFPKINLDINHGCGYIRKPLIKMDDLNQGFSFDKNQISKISF